MLDRNVSTVRRRLFTTLCALVFLVNFGRVVFAPLVPEFRSSLGLSAAAVGSVTTLTWVGTALPRIPIGYLLTRVRRERVVVATGVGLTGAATFTATADSLLTLRIGALAIGLATGGYFVAAIPLIGALYPAETGRRLGIHGTASQIAPVVAPALIVFIVAQFGDWRLAFRAMAACSAVVTVVLVWIVRGRDIDTEEPTRDFGIALARWRTICVGLVFVAVTGFVWQGTFNFYVSYLLTKNLPEATANGLLTLTFAAGLPAFWLGGRLADRLPNIPYLLGINVTFVIGLLGITYLDSVIGVAVASVAMGLSIHALFPATDTYLLRTLPETGRAAAYALFSGVALLLESGGSGVVGTLVDRGITYNTTYRVFALAIVASTVLALLLYRIGRVPTPPSDPS